MKNTYANFLQKTCLVLFLGFIIPHTTSASTLSFEPESLVIASGKKVRVDVVLDTNDTSINAVSGTILFPEELIKLDSIVTTDSLVQLWLESPHQTTPGHIAFEGLITNPGFSGKGGIATLYFSPIETGSGQMSFITGLVLANDGQGTNVLQNTHQAHVTVQQQDTLAQAETQRHLASTDPLGLVLGQIRPPVVTSYIQNPFILSQLAIQGVTYPNATVRVWIEEPNNQIDKYTVQSDAGGNFTYQHEHNNEDGAESEYTETANALLTLSQLIKGKIHHFWLAVVVDGVESTPTQSFAYTLGGLQSPQLLFFLFGMIGALVVIGIPLFIFGSILIRRTAKTKQGGSSSDVL